MSFVDLKFFRQQRFSYNNCTRRINIWDGPVRSGKTVASISSWIKYVATAPPGDLVMTGKTNGSLYRNVVRPMEELLGDEMYYHQEFDARVIDLWDRKIYCFGANDERAENKIRGGTFAGGYGDEITLWPESYWTMLLGRLSVKGAKFLGTTNPDNPSHYLKKNFIDRRNELNLNVFRWPIDCNINLDPEYIESLKKEYTGLWYKRYILGQWCVAEGAIYDFFDKKIHMVDKVPEAKYYAASIDYGTKNPTSFGLYGINPNTHPKVWRIKGYWWDSVETGRQKTDAELSVDFKNFIGDIKLRGVVIDPAAASFRLQLKNDHRLPVINANNDVLEGIQTQSKMLKSGEYVLVRDSSQKACINEYYGYSWDEKASLRGDDRPLKRGDHTKDEERYLLHTLFGSKRLDYSKLTKM